MSGFSLRRRVPFVQQMESADCGAACLAMVLGYHGRHVSLETAREATGAARGGLSAWDLAEAARHFGLRCRGVRVEVPDLRHLPPASVLHWGFDHFVVLEGLSRGGVRIVDPAGGRKTVSWERFGEQFTGVALTFEPGESFEAGGRRARTLSHYLGRLLRHRGLVSRIVLLSVLLQLFALALPILIGLVVDRVIPRGDAKLLTVMAAGLACVVGFHVLTQLLRSFLLITLRSLLDVQLSVRFMDHLVELPFNFFLSRPTGDLIARYESNRTLRHTLTSASFSTLLDGSLVGLYLVLLLLVNAWIGTLVLLLGLSQVVLFFAFSGRYRERMSEELEAEARAQSQLVEMLSGIETLKALGAELRALERWSHLFVRELNASIARSRLGSVAGALTSGLSLASPLAILVVGAHQVLEGRLTLGSMLALNALAVGFLTPLASLISTALSIQEMRSHIARIDDVLAAAPEQDRSRVRPADALRGAIVLEDVSFRYGEHESWVLREISVEIAAGQKVAIVGKSGAGKSTLARLIVGLYTPASGRVVFDGRDLRELDARSVRCQIGVVTQETRVFATTIRENIALADPGAEMDRIIEAARLAEIHEEIEALPMGYDTPLATGGASLSGGQRQRIALARALLRRPAILLLDEATSDLDTVNELRVIRSLALLRCTRIVIAHRLSTVADADLILVLDQGRLVEGGTHEDLLRRRERYAALVAAQTGR